MRISASRKIQKKYQLYHLLNELSMYVPSEDDFGMFVGYGVMHPLASFRCGNEPEQRGPSEMIQVYNQLDSLIVSAANEESSDRLFSELKDDVNPLIEAGLGLRDFPSSEDGRVHGSDSQVFLGFLESMRQKPRAYEQELRKRGLALHQRVAARGALRGERRFCLATDFEDLYVSFAAPGNYER